MKTSYAKKRKHENPLDDIERTLYSSFSTAANRISHLYTQSVGQQRKAYSLGCRHMADKILHWLETEHGTNQPISPVSLLAFLRQELEDIEGEVADLGPSSSAAQAAAIPSPSSVRTARADGRTSPQENRRARANEVRIVNSAPFAPSEPSTAGRHTFVELATQQAEIIQGPAQSMSTDTPAVLQNHQYPFANVASPLIEQLQANNMQQQHLVAPELTLRQNMAPSPTPMEPMEPMGFAPPIGVDQNMALDQYRGQ